VLGARWLRRFAFNHCDRVIAISDAVRRDLTEKIHVRPSAITTIHDGRDLSRFSAGDGRRSDFFAGTPIESCRRVGVVARLSPEKGHEHFLRAAAAILREVPDAGFAIVGDAALGDGLYAERLVSQAKALGIADRTLFTGFTERVPDVMAGLDILVVPSDAEPFGLVTVEAMAAGKPVVATRAGGSAEIVRDGETGLLVAPRSPESLARSVISLLSSPEQASRMGRAGCRRAWQEFSIERHCQTIRDLYSSLPSA
jgi:glycosyltransferase involved in cell wall biosynthesis